MKSVAWVVGLTLWHSSFLCLGATQPQVHSTGKIYSVCEVLRDLKTLNQRTLSIRGVITGGGHGTFLSGECTSHLSVKGFTWRDAIWLTNPTGPQGVRELDTEARERVRREIRRLRPGQNDRVVVTYTGTLEIKDLEASVVVRPSGQPVAFGFGPDLDAPAQLIITGAKDPEVIRHKD